MLPYGTALALGAIVALIITICIYKYIMPKELDGTFEKESAQKACERLLELGLLNDDEFARIANNSS